ncbi:MAG: hypothetical protein KatS3mg031_2476 [Chitinophagales bacterium]|nr:MAG: hypothetical protein KatS3mg031_2476 [Chitinophagales bacterium]
MPMMRPKPMLSIICLLCSLAVTAQQDSADVKKQEKRKYENEARDRLVLGFSFDNWFHNMKDSVKTKWNSWGCHVYYMYDIPLRKSPISFAPGAGFSASWVKHNSYVDDTLMGQTVFRPHPDSVSFKRNSFVTAFFEVPLELRYRSKPDAGGRSFKLGIGVIGGVQIHNHFKIKTDDDPWVNSGDKQIIKIAGFDAVERWKFAGTFRIGYGAVNLFFSYTITNLFKDEGPKVHPFSAGFSINGL